MNNPMLASERFIPQATDKAQATIAFDSRIALELAANVAAQSDAIERLIRALDGLSAKLLPVTSSQQLIASANGTSELWGVLETATGIWWLDSVVYSTSPTATGLHLLTLTGINNRVIANQVTAGNVSVVQYDLPVTLPVNVQLVDATAGTGAGVAIVKFVKRG